MKLLLKILCVLFVMLCACNGSNDYEKKYVERTCVTLICINDYQYYYIRQNMGGLAPRLNSDGTPCHCNTETDSIRVKYLKTSYTK